jgi:hypothetical protein
MDHLQNTSVIGRLLEEISWQKAVMYRAGGRGIEDVLTAEVFLPLDYLPRGAFLGEVFRRAHGAGDVRALAAEEIEEATFTLLPDEVLVGPRQVKVQPDGFVSTSSALVLLEAKRIRRSKFQTKQLARELLALHQHSGGRRALLLLVLGAPPPVMVDQLGRVSLESAVAQTIDAVLEETGVDDVVASDVVDSLDETVAWITWAEISQLVSEQAKDLDDLAAGLDGTVRRLAADVVRAVDWHG